jgi:uncharacterized protein YjiK
MTKTAWLSAFAFTALATPSLARAADVTVRSSFKIPMLELSSLTALPSDDGTVDLLTLGDDDTRLATLHLSRGLRTLRFTAVDVAPVMRSDEREQYEGLARDGAGRVFVAQEWPARIHVLSSALDAKAQTIALDWSSLVDVTDAGALNLLGEGLLLLRNGHVVVVKEAEPAALIEFGPAGDEAAGISPATMLGAGETWPLAGDAFVTFEPLHVWRVPHDARHILKDLSDVALGPDGRLYVLSDESRLLADIGTRLDTRADTLRPRRHWDLPHAMEHCEGLAFAGASPIIVTDRKNDAPTVFVLEPLR